MNITYSLTFHVKLTILIIVFKKGLVLLFGDLMGILQVLLQILDADIAYSTFVCLRCG